MPKVLGKAYMNELLDMLAAERKQVSSETYDTVIAEIKACESLDGGPLYGTRVITLAFGVSRHTVKARASGKRKLVTLDMLKAPVRAGLIAPYVATGFGVKVLMQPSLTLGFWKTPGESLEALALSHRIVRLKAPYKVQQRIDQQRIDQQRIDQWRLTPDGRAITTV